jgi:hypothetical protein
VTLESDVTDGVGAEGVDVGGGAMRAVGRPLGAAETAGAEPVVRLALPAPAEHALARSVTAVVTARMYRRRDALMSLDSSLGPRARGGSELGRLDRRSASFARQSA